MRILRWQKKVSREVVVYDEHLKKKIVRPQWSAHAGNSLPNAPKRLIADIRLFQSHFVLNGGFVCRATNFLCHKLYFLLKKRILLLVSFFFNFLSYWRHRNILECAIFVFQNLKFLSLEKYYFYFLCCLKGHKIEFKKQKGFQRVAPIF